MDKELLADILSSVHEMADIENGEIQPNLNISTTTPFLT